MARPNDGGYAFPQALDSEQSYPGAEGMSLRDYFAAKTMQAEIITSFSDATPEAAAAFAAGAEAAGHTPEQHVAFIAYRIADAMIAERKRESS